MEKAWLWLGGIAVGLAVLGLVFSSVFDMTGNAVKNGPFCRSDSIWVDAQGRSFSCNYGQRCVPDLARCMDVGVWTCLDGKSRIFVPMAGTSADFQMDNCLSTEQCVQIFENGECVSNALMERHPTWYPVYS